jgi:hypothetical protein
MSEQDLLQNKELASGVFNTFVSKPITPENEQFVRDFLKANIEVQLAQSKKAQRAFLEYSHSSPNSKTSPPHFNKRVEDLINCELKILQNNLDYLSKPRVSLTS